MVVAASVTTGEAGAGDAASVTAGDASGPTAAITALGLAASVATGEAASVTCTTGDAGGDAGWVMATTGLATRVGGFVPVTAGEAGLVAAGGCVGATGWVAVGWTAAVVGPVVACAATVGAGVGVFSSLLPHAARTTAANATATV
jgi:hypothetical protein